MKGSNTGLTRPGERRRRRAVNPAWRRVRASTIPVPSSHPAPLPSAYYSDDAETWSAVGSGEAPMQNGTLRQIRGNVSTDGPARRSVFRKSPEK
jgi:hypothetical protein